MGTASARVGDIVNPGKPIPPNVVRFTDRHADEGAVWTRIGTDPLEYGYNDPILTEPLAPGFGWPADKLTAERDGWFPLTVIEVDP